jgi:hypothetical protein
VGTRERQVEGPSVGTKGAVIVGAPSNRASKRRPQSRSAAKAPAGRSGTAKSGSKQTRSASGGKQPTASGTRRRRPAPPPPSRPRWPFFVGALVLVLGAFAFYQFHRTASPKTGPTYLPPLTVGDPSTLPGIQNGPPPWTAGHDGLRERLRALGLPALGAEGTVLHTHEHLDVFVHGTRVTVPATIGIDPAGQFIAPLHTHDASGVIHVESPTQRAFSLGQFFDVWGVLFTRDCVGSLCSSGADHLRVYVDGQEAAGDPRRLELFSHEQIVVTYGTDAELPSPIPDSFGFPLGE